MCEQRKPHRVVWLASYPDGALRQRHGENRYYRRLPAVEFFFFETAWSRWQVLALTVLAFGSWAAGTMLQETA